nr:hypothetical protein [Micavibrio sp.]
MKTISRLLTFSAAAILSISTANAQDPAYYQNLNDLNKINNYSPDKSPRHENADEILSDRILDRKNEVIGEVRNVILNANGSIAMVEAQLDRI